MHTHVYINMDGFFYTSTNQQPQIHSMYTYVYVYLYVCINMHLYAYRRG